MTASFCGRKEWSRKDPDPKPTRQGGRKRSLPQRKDSFRKPDARAPLAAPVERASGRTEMRQGVGGAEAQPARAAGRQSQMADRKAVGIAPQVEEPTGSRPELSGSGQGSPSRSKRRARALSEPREVETEEGFGPIRIRTGLGKALYVPSRGPAVGRIELRFDLEGSRKRGVGDFGSRAVLRSRTELAPDRGCEGSRFGACSGRLTWRQKAGGSLPVDAADGPQFEAFALRRRVRRRRKGALLPDDAAKDRGRGACFSCDVRQRMDRGSLRFEAANGSRGGVRFPSKVRRVEGSGFASMPGSRRGCGWDCKVRLRFRRALAGRRIGLARAG